LLDKTKEENFQAEKSEKLKESSLSVAEFSILENIQQLQIDEHYEDPAIAEEMRKIKQKRRKIIWVSIIAVVVVAAILAFILLVIYLLFGSEAIHDIFSLTKYALLLIGLGIPLFIIPIIILLFFTLAAESGPKTAIKNEVKKGNFGLLLQNCSTLPVSAQEAIRNPRKYSRAKYSLLALANFTTINAGRVIYRHLQRLAPETIYYFFEKKRFKNAGILYECNLYALLEILLKRIAKINGYTLEELIERYNAEVQQLKIFKPATPALKKALKIIYLKKAPREKSMISSLLLDFEHDTIIACPFCRHMAERELLEQWLEKEGTCPVCLQDLTIEECLEVRLQRKTKQI